MENVKILIIENANLLYIDDVLTIAVVDLHQNHGAHWALEVSRHSRIGARRCRAADGNATGEHHPKSMTSKATTRPPPGQNNVLTLV